MTSGTVLTHSIILAALGIFVLVTGMAQSKKNAREIRCSELSVMNRPGSTFSRDASVRIQTRLSGTGLS
ncbi:hypothetical protein DFH08DRAFT_953969 [Mycena albidolilacea]|uniref:Uncharacterized protein n=1 Tax=Mycena albidolilacea TaxID=1033008 RepID=A0AAD7AEL2_9AGAR|nr:hypothetical protein DFH08DRAFT_953969 [Mycena albidolilacea]